MKSISAIKLIFDVSKLKFYKRMELMIKNFIEGNSKSFIESLTEESVIQNVSELLRTRKSYSFRKNYRSNLLNLTTYLRNKFVEQFSEIDDEIYDELTEYFQEDIPMQIFDRGLERKDIYLLAFDVLEFSEFEKEFHLGGEITILVYRVLVNFKYQDVFYLNTMFSEFIDNINHHEELKKILIKYYGDVLDYLTFYWYEISNYSENYVYLIFETFSEKEIKLPKKLLVEIWNGENSLDSLKYWIEYLLQKNLFDIEMELEYNLSTNQLQ